MNPMAVTIGDLPRFDRHVPTGLNRLDVAIVQFLKLIRQQPEVEHMNGNLPEHRCHRVEQAPKEREIDVRRCGDDRKIFHFAAYGVQVGHECYPPVEVAWDFVTPRRCSNFLVNCDRPSGSSCDLIAAMATACGAKPTMANQPKITILALWLRNGSADAARRPSLT